MRFRFHSLLPVLIVVLGLTFLAGNTCWARGVELSSSEQDWLDAHPVIRLGLDADYGPYSFLDAAGNLQGVAADFVTEIELHLDIRFEIVTNLSWPELMEAIQERRLDAVATVVKRPEREAFLEFTEIYLPTPLVIMTRSDTPQLDSFKELQQLRLSLVEGYSSSKQLVDHFPNLLPRYVSTPLEGLRTVASGAADAYVGVLGVNSFLAARHGITNLKVNAAFDMAENGQRFGVRKDWPQLAQLLDKALADISAEHSNAIFQRWLPQHAGEIKRLSKPSYMTRLFPWLLGGLGLTLLGYLVVLLWNRQLKKELAKRRTELERAQAIAHFGDWSLKVKSGRIHLSDELFRIAGLSPQSVTLDWPILRGWIHPDERKQHEDYLQQLSQSRPGVFLPPLISHLIRPDGESRWLEITCTVEFDATNNPVHFQGTAQDITERQLAEKNIKEAKEIIERSSIVVILWKNTEGWPIEIITENARELFGYTAHEFMSGRVSYANIIHPDDLERVTTEVANHSSKSNATEFTQEYRIITKAGETRWIDDQTVLRKDIHGNITHYQGIIFDITERKQTEQSLRRAQKMDAIGQLTGGIAHDFNNILAIILGNLDLLERQLAADDQAQKRVETIRKSTQRAIDLTRQLLGFSRSQVAQVVETNINRLIESMEDLIARSVTPQVELEHHFAQDLWLTAIDPGDFEDSLLNLVLNARDAMAGSGSLTLETRNCTLDAAYCSLNPDVAPGEYVQLSVSDTGEGIPTEMMERVFEPFFSTKTLGKGTGLGLAMVYGFVSRSDGHIKIYSESGIGTTFRVYLPRANGRKNSAMVNIERPKGLLRGRETILVVDDEIDLLELAQESLEALGYQVLTANDGRQALQHLLEDPGIALLFTDVVMPGGINGYELAEQATAGNPDLKVLLNSGYTEKAVAYNGQARFNANLLSKPFTQAELAWRIRALLDEQEQPDVGQNDPGARPTDSSIES